MDHFQMKIGVLFVMSLLLWVMFMEIRQLPSVDETAEQSVLQKVEMQSHSPLIVVTGASSNHYDIAASVLLPSLRKYRPLNSKIVFYDLGLDKQQVSELGIYYKDVLVVPFPYDEYPPHFDIQIDAGYWAWKPAIVQKLVEQYPKSIVLWLDGGNQLSGDITPLLEIIRKRGVFSQRSSGTMQKWVHPKMYEYLDIDPKRYRKVGNCDGAIVAIDGSNTNAKQNVLQPWLACAMIKACIAPEGSSRSNHRQDQAALTIFMRKDGQYQCRKDEAKQHHVLKHIDNTPEGRLAISMKQKWTTNGPQTILLTVGTNASFENLKLHLQHWYRHVNPFRYLRHLINISLTSAQLEYICIQYPQVHIHTSTIQEPITTSDLLSLLLIVKSKQQPILWIHPENQQSLPDHTLNHHPSLDNYANCTLQADTKFDPKDIQRLNPALTDNHLIPPYSHASCSMQVLLLHRVQTILDYYNTCMLDSTCRTTLLDQDVHLLHRNRFFTTIFQLRHLYPLQTEL